MSHPEEAPAVLAPYRVGSVGFLNAVPLTRGLETEIVFATPSKLAVLLQKKQLDAALVSVTEVLFHDAYHVLDGISVASHGEVKSVLLAHREPLEAMRRVYCDPASLTSVNLLKVLLAERNLRPSFLPLPDQDPESMPENVLLIGDRAIEFARAQPTHALWDLGSAWHELTRLPFVYAVWAIRKEIDHAILGRLLRGAKALGLQTLDDIIRDRPEFDFQFRKEYLSRHIQFDLAKDEKLGLNRFMELLQTHGLGSVYPPRFVTQ